MLTGIEERWRPYRRALRTQDQERFDQLFDDARAHADAAGYLNADEPWFPIFFSMLLEQQRRIESLQRRTMRLEETLDIGTTRTVTADQSRLTPPDSDGPED